ncbi:hypothetical protein G432_12290 [Sphingomonas sp. MM-1]|uniref:hypothetical protein n=1 Tax=Sphingomonas sp. MM-1 TaxID=745310 RepID=UPI0002C09A7B|nr:hypothetical protein [Sphingomonas sp. MM-1]AGH50179.1 hypothetical protein G432_12290 [Sphingomonas sp. MM-1]
MDPSDWHFGDLPWGWWLRARDGVLEDQDGRTWCTVRDAFWHGELAMPSSNVVREQVELLQRVLTAIHGRWLGGAERQQDLFDGSMVFWRFYPCWLASIGLIEPRARGTVLEAPLTPKGRSVMLMLQATRDPAWEALPMSEVLEAVSAAERGTADEAREQALRDFERSLGRRRHLFAREQVGRSHLVTLTGVAIDARMPTLRVMWSQAFATERARDDLFAWLATRVDRWDDWGLLAYRKGADALTRHLFSLVLLDGSTSS